jgi:hypothetical protein
MGVRDPLSASLRVVLNKTSRAHARFLRRYLGVLENARVYQYCTTAIIERRGTGSDICVSPSGRPFPGESHDSSYNHILPSMVFGCGFLILSWQIVRQLHRGPRKSPPARVQAARGPCGLPEPLTLWQRHRQNPVDYVWDTAGERRTGTSRKERR